MAETEKLPGIGKVKKSWVWIGVAVTAVIVGYAYIKHRQGGSASSVTAADTAAIDPATGYPTGSAQDLAALQAQTGASAGYDSYGGSDTGTGQQLYYDPADGLYDLTSPYTGTATGTGTTTTTPNTGPGTFSDDAYWVSYAEQNVTGYAASAIQGALAAYLAGIPLTTTQMSIYQAAIAVAGQPPSPGPTPTLATQSTSGTSSGSSSGSGPVTVVPQGFRATVSGLTVTLSWTNPPLPAGQGPIRSVIVAYGQSATSLPYQQTVGAGATSTTITFNSGAGSAGLTHYFEAWYDPANTGGPHAGPISAKTT